MFKKGSWQYRVYRVLRLLAVGYGTLLLFACTMADRMIFMPPPASYSLTDEGVVQFGVAKEFSGIYRPTSEAGTPTLLWAHGNAEDAGSVDEVASLFSRQGFGVMVYDYPGYGHSKGKPNEQGVYRSADAAYDFLTKEQGVPPEMIVLVGQSVGGGSASYLAEEGKGAGLVLISPFKSAFRVITKVKVLPWDRFDNLKRMGKIEMPLLVIHGDVDEVIPHDHGIALYEKHSGPKEMLGLKGVGHNDLWALANQAVVEAIEEFWSRIER
ncbi:alpha/beta fold hydrolase [Roseibacillus persicicus]|uniref:alpha/beta hydrolase n=1 Tax=Roseibacillus persicicus TaxID=454148 RepID=UPI00398BACEE